MILEGKKILITGVLSRQSIAFRCAQLAQQEGAEILLTSFGRVMSLTEKTARRLSPVPDVLELDVNNTANLAALTEELSGAGAGSTAPSTRSRTRPTTRSAATSSTLPGTAWP